MRERADPDEVEDEDDEPTRVIFSLTVISDAPIVALKRFLGRGSAPKPDDDYLYSIFHTDFEDDDWDTRAQHLDTAVNDGLDLLDASGVDPTRLAADDVVVRAFFTFGPGAETLQPSVVKRLAGYKATIWIDANG